MADKIDKALEDPELNETLDDLSRTLTDDEIETSGGEERSRLGVGDMDTEDGDDGDDGDVGDTDADDDS